MLPVWYSWTLFYLVLVESKQCHNLKACISILTIKVPLKQEPGDVSFYKSYYTYLTESNE